MTEIVLIAAMDANRAIGVDNGLPWHLPDDLKRFKALTTGRTVLMGRKTAESLGRALPGRINLVLTRSGRAPFEGMQAVASLAQALQACGHGDLMVIGGAEVYALALPHAQRMHLTHVDACLASADAYFPGFDVSQWRLLSETAHAADEKHPYAFRYSDYRRFSPSA